MFSLDDRPYTLCDRISGRELMRIGGLNLLGLSLPALLAAESRAAVATTATDPTFEVAFLDGQETPFLETRDGFRTDGVEWKIRQDFGVAAVDFRTAVTNAGV